MTKLPLNMTQRNTWDWNGYSINYQFLGQSGAAILFIHGFGASLEHWRKNLPELGEFYRCFALDLLGFGASAKPFPEEDIEYTIETWAQQVNDFCREVVGSPVFLVGNSIGCVIALQAAVDNPEQILGIAALNCSLRLLHERKRKELPWYRNYGTVLVQNLLSNLWIGRLFFRQIAQPNVVRNILSQAYYQQDAITDELVDILLSPSKEPGAADVFLAFTRYSQGPLPEDLLPKLRCPVIFLWGAEDPWEPLELGRNLAKFPVVEDFIVLEQIGHCPQDEAPEIVNNYLHQWIERHTT